MTGRPSMRAVELGLGCAPIGNLFQPVSEEAARGAVQAALDAGIRFFDTAPHYGAGLSEQRLGAALAGVPRSSFTVATKVGRRLVDERGREVPPGVCGHDSPLDPSYDGVRRSLEGSLIRLGLDRVDVAYLHDPENVDEALEGAFRALADMRAQGIVGAIGVGMNDWEPLARFVTQSDPDVIMVAGRITLLDSSAVPGLLPIARQTGVEVTAAGVFNSGILADPSPGAPYFYRPADTNVLDRALALQQLCSRHKVSLATAALHYPRLFSEVTRVIVGARSPEEVASAAHAWHTAVPEALWAELARTGMAVTTPMS